MIKVQNLTKIFQSGSHKFTAVDHLNFQTQAGEVYGLLGPNGAGKTTTLRMILGLLKPTSGEALIDGISVNDQPEEVKKRIGLVSASAGLYQWLTPREIITFFANVYGIPDETSQERLDKIGSLLDINEFLDQRCSTLSTGQKQRVNLVRALIHDPPIMLLDEPTRGLDIAGTHIIFEYIAHLKELGKAVIVCTHRLDEAERLCNRLGLLHKGKLCHEGTFEELKKETGCQSLSEIFIRYLPELQLSRS
jgi:sodium transport system ATP-binding protein